MAAAAVAVTEQMFAQAPAGERGEWAGVAVHQAKPGWVVVPQLDCCQPEAHSFSRPARYLPGLVAEEGPAAMVEAVASVLSAVLGGTR